MVQAALKNEDDMATIAGRVLPKRGPGPLEGIEMLDVMTTVHDEYPGTVRVNGHRLTCVPECVCNTPWDAEHAIPSRYTARLYHDVMGVDLNFHN
jgi:hypothetical protein